MLACGCAWLRSRCAPLTAVAASLPRRCRLRRNAGLCHTRGMRGYGGRAAPGRYRHPCSAGTDTVQGGSSVLIDPLKTSPPKSILELDRDCHKICAE